MRSNFSPNSAFLRIESGFTLIELSIVLVIIGLILGGVLVGQDLIRAASVRAQISQIEKYHQAVNTFRVKYGALPGDISATSATQFGLASRSGNPGEGDGNGVIEGTHSRFPTYAGRMEGEGETGLFWTDLSSANLIEGTFASTSLGGQTWTGSGLNLWFPQAKIGNANLVYVWSGGWQINNGVSDNTNYFGLSMVSSLQSNGPLYSASGLTVSQAYGIDKKVDDGYPQSGNVMAFYNNNGAEWANSGPYSAPYATATIGSSGSCYDNGNVAGATQQYSVEISNGANVNCALSFRFQ